MNRLKHNIAVMASALLLTLLLAFSAFAQTESDWEYHDGNWYYIDANGKMAANQWLKTGNMLYWMNEDGTMATNTWLEKDHEWYYFDSSGGAVSGWNKIGDDWYYFDEDTHTMVTNTYIGSWYVGKDGAWSPGKYR